MELSRLLTPSDPEAAPLLGRLISLPSSLDRSLSLPIWRAFPVCPLGAGLAWFLWTTSEPLLWMGGGGGIPSLPPLCLGDGSEYPTMTCQWWKAGAGGEGVPHLDRLREEDAYLGCPGGRLPGWRLGLPFPALLGLV